MLSISLSASELIEMDWSWSEIWAFAKCFFLTQPSPHLYLGPSQCGVLPTQKMKQPP